MLTAAGKLSRNLEVGKRLGRGQTLDEILKETGFIPEGINTVQSVHQMIQKNNFDLPICNKIYEVIFEEKPLKTMLDELMRLPLTLECKT